MAEFDATQSSISVCCNADLIAGAGCPACKTCAKCGRFLGCFNLASYNKHLENYLNIPLTLPKQYLPEYII